MNQQEFAKLLEKKNYSYELENGMLIVTHEGDVDLSHNDLATLPESCIFQNGGPPFRNPAYSRMEAMLIWVITPSRPFQNPAYSRMEAMLI